MRYSQSAKDQRHFVRASHSAEKGRERGKGKGKEVSLAGNIRGEGS